MKFEVKGFEILSKRFYLPVQHIEKCFNCGNPVLFDLEDNYLSYPVVGEQIEVWSCCDQCYEENLIKVKLNLKVEIIP